ncbi:MAG: HSP90 family protein [Pirellula sp.]|nr:HSP90 family protein [Pirellula sp.]
MVKLRCVIRKVFWNVDCCPRLACRPIHLKAALGAPTIIVHRLRPGCGKCLSGKCMSGKHRFQVNLRGIVDLLAKHLYSRPELFLRELLQNSVDAITARKRLDDRYEGSIRLEIAPADDGLPTLTIVDDGIGMDEAELHRFLATIGESSKRDGGAFLGQFGIGMLAGFMVSDEIIAVSKSARSDSPAVQWHGKENGTYDVRTLAADIEPGTRVSLQSRADCTELFEPTRIAELALHFGRLLPYPIYVNELGGAGSPINSETVPWRASFKTERAQTAALLEYGRRALREDFLDAVPLKSTAGGVDGVAYVSAHSVNLAAQRKHQVYLKNMLLSDEAEGLLPEWAFFVKAVVNVERLRPTASREGFYVDERLEATRTELGECLKQYLMHLPQRDPQRFERFLAVHHLALKSLAAEDDDCFRIFIDWLPFETTYGRKTIRELRADGAEVRYVAELGQFLQIAKVAQAQGLLVVNAGYVYDAALLGRVSEVFPDFQVLPVDVAQFSADLAEPTAEQQRLGRQFLDAAMVSLRPYDCIAELKRFQPPELPALFAPDQEARFFRSVEQAQETADPLYGGILAALTSHRSAPRSIVYFNVENSTVRRLLGVGDERVLARSAEILYVQSLLLAQQPLTSRELSLLTRGLGGLIDAAVERKEQPDVDAV